MRRIAAEAGILRKPSSKRRGLSSARSSKSVRFAEEEQEEDCLSLAGTDISTLTARTEPRYTSISSSMRTV